MVRLAVPTLVLLAALGVPAAAAEPPVLRVGGVPLPGIPVAVTAAASAARTAALPSEVEADPDPRVDLTVEPGVTELIAISRGYLNQLITPFADPKLITANPIEFNKQGRSLFVTTSSEDPVGIHILSNDPDEERSIALALVPKAIAPRTIRLHLAGGGPVDAGSAPQARAWEEAAPYEATLVELLSATARGQIPQGYALETTRRTVPCALGGITLDPGQRLTGSHFSVLVMRATNRAGRPVEIHEPACYAPGVVAVAAWPRAALGPGEATELYVVVSNAAYAAAEAAPRRPSLLEAAR